MEDVKQVISRYPDKDNSLVEKKPQAQSVKRPSESSIPDIFFDRILSHYKMGRVDISLLLFLYRQVWCKPNINRSHGIGNIQTYSDISDIIKIPIDEVQQSLRSLERHGFIETIRAGQYFVRRYFTESFDQEFGQNYSNFE